MDLFAVGLKLKTDGAALAKASIDEVRKSASDLNKESNKMGEMISSSFADLAKKAVAAASAVTVLSTAYSLLKNNTIEAQEADAAMVRAIQTAGAQSGQTAQSMRDLASSIQNMSTFGDEAAMSMQTMLLTFNKISGETFPRTAIAVTDLAARFGMDLTSAAKLVGKALQDPEKGMSQLRRVGVDLSDATEELAIKMQKMGDTAGAQNIILTELEQKFSGSAAAAKDTLGGALTSLSNAFGDLFEVSKEGTSGLTAGINSLTDAVVSLRENMDKVVIAGKALIGVIAAPFIAKQVAALVAYNTALVASTTAKRAEAAATLAQAQAQLLADQRFQASAANRLSALTALRASTEQLAAAQLRLSMADNAVAASTVAVTAAQRALTAQTTLLGGAMARGAAIAKGFWAAIGGPIGAVIIGAIAVNAAIDSIINKKQKAIDEEDARQQKELDALLERNRQKREADKQKREDDRQAQEDAIAAAKQRVQNLIELGKMNALTARETDELRKTQTLLRLELESGNIALERRLEILKQRQEIQTLIRRPLTPADTTKRPKIETPNIDIVADQAFDKMISQMNPFSDPKFADKLSKEISDSFKNFKIDLPPDLQVALDIRNNFAEAVTDSLIDGFSAGISEAIASGKISEGFKALGSTLLGGLGRAMIAFGAASLKVSVLMETIKTSLASFLPGGAVAASVAMIALGSVLAGAAASAFGGGAGSRAVGIGAGGMPTGMGGMGGGVIAPSQLFFGQTSATTAAGMQPRQAINITVIGPNDPAAQRAIQELISKANSRGSLG